MDGRAGIQSSVKASDAERLWRLFYWPAVFHWQRSHRCQCGSRHALLPDLPASAVPHNEPVAQAWFDHDSAGSLRHGCTVRFFGDL